METRFDAEYFDGRSAQMRRVEAVRDGDSLVIHGEALLIRHALRDVRIAPRVGELPLRMSLPDGALLVADAEAVARVLPIPRAAGLAHRLESRIAFVVASLAGLAIAGWFGYHDGIPWLAKRVAEHIPPSLETRIADEGLAYLDRIAFRPSRAEEPRQARLRQSLAKLAAPLGPAARNARLEFRDGGWIGANAFALPGGVVVVTDQLLKALPNDDHVVAVLSHELGHLDHRHGARTMLQSSIAGLASLALFGDASSVSGLAATLPTALVHTSYSRDFEREADAFAFELLRRSGRSPRLVGEALVSLEAASRARAEVCRTRGDEDRPRDDDFDIPYLSSHPRTAERAAAAERAASGGS